LRKLAAAILAVPIIVVLYIPLIARRSAASRTALVLGVLAFGTVGVIGLSGPSGTTATPPSNPVPVTTAAVRTDLRVGQAPNAPISISFSTPMNSDSVAAALRIEPSAAVETSWDTARTLLTLTPRTGWRPGTFYTVTVQPGALAESGRPLSRPVLAAFLVRDATVARVAASRLTGGRAALSTTFRITFDHPVEPATVARAFRIKPAIAGTLLPVGRRSLPTAFVFQPSAPLSAHAAYHVSLGKGVLDADGAAVAAMKAVTIRTIVAPRVIRFRPTKFSNDAARTANVSVRFSEPMNRASTKAAWAISVNGKAVPGSITFAEHNTVLVFDPRSAFDYRARVRVAVRSSAKSAAGVPLGRTVRSVFLTVRKPSAAKSTTSRTVSTTAGGGGGGGGAVGGGSWGAVESYYLRLMNCTRTGGWVTSSGSCSSAGGSGIAALRLDSGISSSVSRPYARYLATHNECSHFIGGGPGDRLRRAGYTSYVWAENIGCRSGNPYDAVLGSHLFFQSEKSYGGGHYVNMMNSKYDRAGIGVWVYSGRVRLVVDFYHPL
jgi:uncharacterized protein YkwD